GHTSSYSITVRCVPIYFSSRRRHTRSKRDWSSDVCSSDLIILLSFTLFCTTFFLLFRHQKLLPKKFGDTKSMLIISPKLHLYFRYNWNNHRTSFCTFI